jgi:hypothetical protein
MPIANVKIKFAPLDEGGLGFQTADEIRRRSSAAASSPQIMAMNQAVVVEEEERSTDE